MPSIPPRLPARLGDIALQAMARLFVPQIQLIVDLEGELDGDRLRRALRLLLDAEPVLGCRFVPRWVSPYWQRLGEEEVPDDSLLEVEDAHGPARERATQRFLGADLPADEGPRLRVLWLRGGGGDRLVIKAHHQAMDAGGTKAMAYRLARLYRRLEDEPDLVPIPNLGTRSMWQPYRQFSPRAWLGMYRRYLVDAWQSRVPGRSMRLPMGRQAEGPPRFQVLHVGGPRLQRLREHPSSATLNDLVAAALLRALAGASGWRGQGTIRYVGTVDLRRYLPRREADALCNLSSFMFPRLGPRLGGRFDDTVTRLKAVTDAIKADHFGLGFNLGSAAVAWALPAGVIERVLFAILDRDRRRGTMPPVFTNMGPIDPLRLDFGAPAVDHAHLVVPAAYPDLFAIGLSGFRGRLSLTAGHFEPALPAEQLARLLRAVDEELPG